MKRFDEDVVFLFSKNKAHVRCRLLQLIGFIPVLPMSLNRFLFTYEIVVKMTTQNKKFLFKNKIEWKNSV